MRDVFGRDVSDPRILLESSPFYLSRSNDPKDPERRLGLLAGIPVGSDVARRAVRAVRAHVRDGGSYDFSDLLVLCEYAVRVSFASDPESLLLSPGPDGPFPGDVTTATCVLDDVECCVAVTSLPRVPLLLFFRDPRIAEGTLLALFRTEGVAMRISKCGDTVTSATARGGSWGPATRAPVALLNVLDLAAGRIAEMPGANERTARVPPRPPRRTRGSSAPGRK